MNNAQLVFTYFAILNKHVGILGLKVIGICGNVFFVQCQDSLSLAHVGDYTHVRQVTTIINQHARCELQIMLIKTFPTCQTRSTLAPLRKE